MSNWERGKSKGKSGLSELKHVRAGDNAQWSGLDGKNPVFCGRLSGAAGTFRLRAKRQLTPLGKGGVTLECFQSRSTKWKHSVTYSRPAAEIPKPIPADILVKKT